MKKPSLAIIGAGFSGAALVIEALGTRKFSRVTLIDRSGRFGPGLAYSTAQPAHLLNVRAGKLSALADKPNDFADWLRPNVRDMAPGTLFAPRTSYGAYLEAHVRRAARESGGALTLVREAALRCERGARGVRITLASGAVIEADYGVLAMGHAAAQVPKPYDQLGGSLINPWDVSAMGRIPPQDDVLLIGSGLTMIDAALSLTSGPRTGKLIALSRRGLLPRPHADEQRAVQRPLPLPARLSEALHAVRKEVRAGARWQEVIDRLRQQAPDLWRGLSPEAQARFLRHLRPWWDAHRHRTAPHISIWIKALQSAGLVRVLAGRTLSAERTAAGVRVGYRRRGDDLVETIETAHVVNCTGADNDVMRSADPLMRQMLHDGVVTAHWTQLGLDVGDDGGVIGPDGAPCDRLFALGPLTQGAFWEIIAIPEIRARAAELAQRLTEARRQKRKLFG